jgi:Protein of unknown function (DUF2846)
MKKLLSLLLLCSIVLSAEAQADSTRQTATVYFMRSTGFTGSAQGFTVFIDDNVVCKLNNKRYSVHQVAPGTHRFSVQFAGKNAKDKAERIEISTEAGKTYYIQLIFQSGLLKNNLYCQEVTESSAKTILGNLKEDSCN